MRILKLAALLALVAACGPEQEAPVDTTTVAPAAPSVVDTPIAEPRGINLALVGRQVFDCSLATAVSQSDVKACSYKPGFSFRIVSVQAYTRTEAGAVTATVKIGTTAALASAIAFATATRSDGTLAGTVAARGGSSASIINVHYTSDGTGALTNGHVVVVIEPSS